MKANPSDQKFQTLLKAADWIGIEKLAVSVLRRNPKDLLANRFLGFSLRRQSRHEEAAAFYQKALKRYPNDAELLINHAAGLLELKRNAEALPFFQRACDLLPSHALTWIKLAQCCYEMGMHEKGMAAAETALAHAKTLDERVAALTQRAIHRRELGQIKEAVLDSEVAIELQPGDASNHHNRLLFMLADPDTTTQQVTAAAKQFAAVFEPVLKPGWPSFEAQRHGPWRRLKIGFLSPDFRIHSVMYFVEGLLAQLDRRQFEVWAFSLDPREDVVTERVRCHVDHFVQLNGLNATRQAQTIREHAIDLLVDLTGHTGGNGLLAMAHKPAPVQVSWLGYPATTGLSAVDYKFTDEVTDPLGADVQYSERLYRLPTLFCCYRPMSRYPLWRYQPAYQVRPAPALANGYVTFGSCNNLGKVTDSVLSLWGRILKAVPKARLLIEGKNFSTPAFVELYQLRCQRLGLDVARLDLVPMDTSQQYLTYHRIDIALDSFPLTGGTTTFDLLWMGVPLVSMVGDAFKSRLSTGILTHLGRPEWLAQSEDEYVIIAQALAADVEQLNQMRLDQRAQVENSVLMREDVFNHHFAEGLRLMWVQWLAQQEHPADIDAQSRQIESWLPDLPSEWSSPPVPGVGVAPGQRLPLPEAHALLHRLLFEAQTSKGGSSDGPVSATIQDAAWVRVTEMAERILDAVPHDPVALACLAEVEHAHGHTDFAVCYLRYAQEAIARA